MFFTNVRFTKKISFCERFKLRPVLSMKNTPFTFFAFFPRLHVNFFKKISSPHSWGVKKPSCKNWYVFGENWQRNQFPKLDTFLLIFHSCYNFAIVKCMWRHVEWMRVDDWLALYFQCDQWSDELVRWRRIWQVLADWYGIRGMSIDSWIGISLMEF